MKNPSFLKKNKISGIIAVACASLMWAIEAVLSKLSMQTSSFIQTNMTRVGIVAVVGLIYAALTDRKSLKISFKQLGAIAYISFAGTIFADLVYLYCLTKIPVVNAVLIGHLQPIFIILIGFIILKEDKLHVLDYLGIIIMILSGLLVTTRTPQNLMSFHFGSLEDLYVLAATLAWASATIAVRKFIPHINSGTLTFYRFALAFIALSAYLLIQGQWAIHNPYQIIVGVVVGAGYILYYEGLKRMHAAVVGAMELCTPFFAAILGFIFLGETVTLMQIGGIFMLAVGVFTLSSSGHKD